MLVGDHIDVGLVTEIAGVVTVNTLYYEVVDATLTTTIEAAIAEIAANLNAACGTQRSDQAVLTCGTWRNRNGNDPFTQATFSIPGTGTAASLPSQAAVRCRRYGVDAGQLKVGAINVTGIVETGVERGRLIDTGEFGSLETFLQNNQILAAGPQLKNGFWYDTNAPSPAPFWVDTDRAQTVSRIRTLERRKTRLCGQ